MAQNTAIILYVGETHITLNGSWVDDTGAVVDLTNTDTTNATMSVRWHTDTVGGASRAGDGVFSSGPRNQGKFKYGVSANDVGLPDQWTLQFKVVYADGTVLFSDPIPVDLRIAL